MVVVAVPAAVVSAMVLATRADMMSCWTYDYSVP